ncbi:hypothetical protein [Actinoplanes sp. NPDC049599]|uniref:hypothetical protein n=1 Tax=Actinoplanes sp. NPDC049599 TaxID=3363903 RepID=UPI003799BB2B
MRSRRIATTAVTALVATGLVAVATTNPATAAGPGPQPVTSWLDAVPAEERSWVSIYWTTGRKICDGAVTVTGEDVRIGYPENTGTYTSFSQSAKLRPGRLDYTAFTVRPRAGAEQFRQVEATLSYNTCGRHAVEKAQTFRLTFAVLPAPAAKK